MSIEFVVLVLTILSISAIWYAKFIKRCMLLMGEHTRKPRRGNYLYAFRGKGESTKYVKVGRAKDPVQRLRTFQTANPNGVEVLAVWAVQDAVKAERHLHQLLASRHHRGEWFRCGPLVLTFIYFTRSKRHTERVRRALAKGGRKRAFV